MKKDARLALCDTRGPLTDLLQKLSGECGEVWLTRLKKMLRGPNLTHLKIAAENIAVTTAAFSKDDFFASKFGVKLQLWGDFKTLVAENTSFIVPAFTGKLMLYTLGKSMYDCKIRAEIGDDQVFSVDEFTAILKALTATQANGEDGTLLTNGDANIFYVRLDENTVVAVYAHWYADDRGWVLDAYRLENAGWSAGHRVFGRS